MGHGPEIIMDIDYVIRLCEGIGVVKKFEQDRTFFGNIELEIETPCKQTLCIISDRGMFSCYHIKTKILGERRYIKPIINNNTDIEIYKLEDAIDLLKEYVNTI